MQGTLGAEARLRDPAHRDQDGRSWHRGRFAERVRRQWNTVDLDDDSPAGDLDGLARTIQAKVGGGVEHVRARLQEFADLDDLADPSAPDPLVKPGAHVG